MTIRKLSKPSRRTSALLALAVVTAVALGAASLVAGHDSTASAGSSASGVHKIKHVIVIMQENRSFDSYFGTYPGAEGLPSQNGVPTSCVPDARTGQCVKPTVDHADVNGGGPHGEANATADINGGQMNGFVDQALGARRNCRLQNNPARPNSAAPHVMGHHTQSALPAHRGAATH